MISKKALLTFALLSLTMIGASSLKPVVLTVVNKSGKEIAVGLVEANNYRAYYLHVPEGTKSTPTKEVFAIERGEYTMNVYYIQIYDPVYGYECDQPGSSTWMAVRNLRVTVKPCDAPAANRGERPLIKSDSWETIY
jgi:hypothetical protein